MAIKTRPPLWLLAAAVLAGALLNVGLNAVNRSLGFPFFFDSVLTAAVAARLGVVPGLATALLTQLGMEVVVTLAGAPGTALPFVFCGFATALIVGIMAARGRLSNAGELLLAVILVTLANAVLGSMTAVFVFGGLTQHASDYLMTGFLLGGRSLLESAFWARLPVNLVDKGIAVGAAFVLLKWLPRPR